MSLKNEKINAIIIIEVAGRPPEHLTKTLNELIDNIGKEKGIEIKERKINEPNLMKDQDDFYTSFAEIEVEVEEILYLVRLMFKYMPAHIEIISPKIIEMKNGDWNEVLNELVRRLHGYEGIARRMQAEKNILEKKLKGEEKE